MRKGARWYSMEMAGVVTYTGAQIIQRACGLVRRRGAAARGRLARPRAPLTQAIVPCSGLASRTLPPLPLSKPPTHPPPHTHPPIRPPGGAAGQAAGAGHGWHLVRAAGVLPRKLQAHQQEVSRRACARAVVVGLRGVGVGGCDEVPLVSPYRRVHASSSAVAAAHYFVTSRHQHRTPGWARALG